MSPTSCICDADRQTGVGAKCGAEDWGLSYFFPHSIGGRLGRRPVQALPAVDGRWDPYLGHFE